MLPKTNFSNKNIHKTSISQGQMLIGVLVALAVFLILSHALFTLVSASYELVGINKARLTAKYLAQEKIEEIRNMDYENIGTIGGIPSGNIDPVQEILRNGINYTVKVAVVFIDDPYDETGNNDLFPDYKRVRVEVDWEGTTAPKKTPMIMITDISSKVVTSIAGTGTLSISVVNAYGNPVNGAEVTIIASSLTPQVNESLVTSFDGNVVLPGSGSCDSCYEIVVTKDGYSTDRTYSTSEVTNPHKPHASIIEGKVTQLSFKIDLLSTLNIFSFGPRDEEFPTLGSVPFVLRGSKEIGTNAFSEPVYKTTLELSTQSDGTLTINDLEWDNYQLYMPSPSSYNISGSQPVLPLNILPGTESDYYFTTQSFSSNSLLAIIKNPAQELIPDAYVTLSEGSYLQEKTSGKLDDYDEGQAFFPDLESKTYTLEATASGYLNYSQPVDINQTTTTNVIMLPE